MAAKKTRTGPVQPLLQAETANTAPPRSDTSPPVPDEGPLSDSSPTCSTSTTNVVKNIRRTSKNTILMELDIGEAKRSATRPRPRRPSTKSSDGGGTGRMTQLDHCRKLCSRNLPARNVRLYREGDTQKVKRRHQCVVCSKTANSPKEMQKHVDDAHGHLDTRLIDANHHVHFGAGLRGPVCEETWAGMLMKKALEQLTSYTPVQQEVENAVTAIIQENAHVARILGVHQQPGEKGSTPITYSAEQGGKPDVEPQPGDEDEDGDEIA